MTTRPQTPFSMSLFSILTTTAALAVFLSAATSQAVTVVTDTIFIQDEFFLFTGVDGPSDSDYADQNAGNGVIASESAGSPEPLFAGFPVTKLNDGIFTGDGALCRNETRNDCRYHYDLVTPIEIAQINSYSSNMDPRSGQLYSVWGSAADTIPSTTTTLDEDNFSLAVGSVRSDLMLAGWTLIADVDVFRGSGGSSGAQITPDSGETSLGNYRWLMFNVQEMGPQGSNFHPNMMEIDVYRRTCDLNGDNVCNNVDVDMIPGPSSARSAWFVDAGFQSADFNLDGTVGASSDGAVLLSNLGAAGPFGHGEGDADGDGLVTASADGSFLLEQLAGDTAAVPEPGSLALLLLGGLGVAVVARRNRRLLTGV